MHTCIHTQNPPLHHQPLLPPSSIRVKKEQRIPIPIPLICHCHAGNTPSCMPCPVLPCVLVLHKKKRLCSHTHYMIAFTIFFFVLPLLLLLILMMMKMLKLMVWWDVVLYEDCDVISLALCLIIMIMLIMMIMMGMSACFFHLFRSKCSWMIGWCFDVVWWWCDHLMLSRKALAIIKKII